jgi:hypothetical protein
MLRHHVVPIGFPAWRWNLDGLTPQLVYSNEESQALGDRWVDHDPAVIAKTDPIPVQPANPIEKPKRGRPKMRKP